VLPEDVRAVDEALTMAGVLELHDRQLGELSGGEQQVVHIAAALAQEANVLLLDEPTTHLDPQHQQQITSLLMRLNRDSGCSIIVATHELNFAARLADRILALKEGRELACDVPDSVLSEDLLGELFGTPFSVVYQGERPVALLDYEA
jgi:iron complex transport system ATP-binding protein